MTGWRPLIFPLGLLWGLEAVSTLHSQAIGREAAFSILSATAKRLRDDPSLPDSLRSLSVERLLAPDNTKFAYLLDDDGAHAYLVVLSALTRQLPLEKCGKLLDPNSSGSTDAEDILAHGDAPLVTGQADVVERIVHARARGTPGGRVATPAEMQGGIMTAIGRLSTDDQTRLITIARNPPPTPEDGCWSVQQIFTALAALPAAAAGPVVRAMFGAPPSAQ
jgi:hypothetical protein